MQFIYLPFLLICNGGDQMDYEQEINTLKEQVQSINQSISIITQDIQDIKNELVKKPDQVDVSEAYDKVEVILNNYSNLLKTMNSQIQQIKIDINNIKSEL